MRRFSIRRVRRLKRQDFCLLLAMMCALGSSATSAAAGEPYSYRKDIEAYREARQQRLLSDGYYLTLAGLFDLKEGDNSFGTDRDNTIVLPNNATDAKVGVVRLQHGKISLRTFDGKTVLVDGKRVTEAALTTDAQGVASIVSFGNVSFWVIQRGDRFLVRMRDLNSPIRANFHGVEFYKPSESNRVVARYEKYDTPKKLPIVNVIGTIDTAWAPGVLIFTWKGEECRLEPQLDSLEDEEFFLVFGDATNGSETYGSGRFLVCRLPENGTTLLDFNKAYNPPCAFSPFTTCPLPPEQNVLPVAIRAGEKLYRHY